MSNPPKGRKLNTFHKCEPCQARRAFKEAYRAIRSLSSVFDGTYLPKKKHLSQITDNASFTTYEIVNEVAREATFSMIDAMPYKQAVYFEAAREVEEYRCARTFEEMPLSQRNAIRSVTEKGAMVGLMPEIALAQREEEACF